MIQKKFFPIVFLFLSLVSITSGQKSNLLFGAGPLYELPIGSLSQRFNGSVGGMFYVGAESSKDWVWTAKGEYTIFNKLNRDKLSKRIEVQQGVSKQVYTFPLKALSMELKTFGFSAEAKYTVLQNELFKTNVVFGFGFSYWQFVRQEYSDSLFADTSGIGTMYKIGDLKVPGNTQSDWSGTINLGIDVQIPIVAPLNFFASVNYKIIIGELWPALALDMENVAGLQFVNFRVGVAASL